ncbi:ATP-binding protein [Candidatus Woesearchaeota archaeon]|nr:ATP-binding protein [Candidatus Woesearchaeota archaeon]
MSKQLVSPKKIYCIDTALILFNSFSTSSNLDRLLENLVFIELKRRSFEIFYYKDKNECDFITRKDNKIKEAIQVCYDFNSNNKESEINGLIGAMNRFNLKSGLILTYNQEDKFIIENKKIILKPV